ncbi:Uncharacterized protein dnm_090340 [Desulfonema magnum]|uniref:Uncharacterized protein n=1 Tax=Desulfonema magnum TaxID=45655 RepID=A0A975BWA6_9BACT|nr:Uncharacterized protein dnm_090340 [Desulfonema magnum]
MGQYPNLEHCRNIKFIIGTFHFSLPQEIHTSAEGVSERKRNARFSLRTL